MPEVLWIPIGAVVLGVLLGAMVGSSSRSSSAGKGALIGLYLFYGFEACGDVAEEVPDPGRLIPKAMRRTIYIGGAAAIINFFADMGGRVR